MHEGAVMQAVFTSILDYLEKTPGARVTCVQLELGASGHFTEEAVRQYFQLLARNTPIEGAELELVWQPALYQCLGCSLRFESVASSALCPRCGDVGLEIVHEDSCEIRRIELVVPEQKDQERTIKRE